MNFYDKRYAGILSIIMIMMILGCSDSPNPSRPIVDPPQEDSTGSVPAVISPDITIEMHGTKISQLIGDYDREQKESTQNRTFSRYELQATDLGVPFTYHNRTYILFGDTWGTVGNNRDAIAYTTDTDPEDGISLTFIHDDDNIYKPITIPGISQGAFEVPAEGVAIRNKMYIYHTTDHSDQVVMGRSVMARSDDEGKTFEKKYTLSTRHFINVSIVKASSSTWKLSPEGETEEEALVMFGSGTYRASDVYLAWQPVSSIEQPESIRYFSGMNDNDKALWSSKEMNAVPLFEQPCVGELSVSYNTFIDRWIMLYNCGDPRGINMRTARFPWGPWTKPQVIFEPWGDGGYCHFMHTSWQFQQCDSVMDARREDEWGGEYGPYQFEDFATGDSTAANPSTTIYFTMSTWNPYTVVLMKAKLANQNPDDE